MSNRKRLDPKGRGSNLRPPNRFGTTHSELDFDHFENDEEFFEELHNTPTEYFTDHSKSIVTENDSPDIPFRFSLNPYRGCSHGCSYCYARPTHEYLGLDAGLDFETKVFVKEQAPQLFRGFLCRPSWNPQPIILSGVTDCYQPAEREFQITRQCLEVAAEARQPVAIITKNALIVRDLSLLKEMARLNLVHVNVSITTLNPHLARDMEPRTSSPAARLKAMRTLTDSGIPVGVMVAPVIPGLNDSEIPQILRQAKESGAASAGYVLLRLPLTVRPVFEEWLERTQPTQLNKIESLIRSTREGKLNDSEFGSRMQGKGNIAQQIEKTFELFTRKCDLDQPLPRLDTSRFQLPQSPSGQLRLF